MTSSLSGGTGFGGGIPTGSKSFSKPPKGYGTFQNYTPQQMQLHQQQFSQVGPDSYLSRLAGGDQSFFDEMEAPAMRQFNELQGGLASRFSGMGTGARRSSGFQNSSTAASSNFAQDLQSKRQELQRQAIMDLMGLSDSLLGQKPYQLYEKQQKPLLGGWGGTLGAAGGGALGFLAGGPTGALKGAQTGFNVFGGF